MKQLREKGFSRPFLSPLENLEALKVVCKLNQQYEKHA